jgi:homoserine dehydrogenase
MKNVRLSIVGFGTVGRWVAEAVFARRAWLAREHDVSITVTSVATRRDGFVARDAGLDIPTLLTLVRSGRPLAEHPGAVHWPTALEGLASTSADVLVEASNTNPREAEPALSHIRFSLERRMHVVTSSKGACAAAAVDLFSLARRCGVELRMESTVMSGTPVLSTMSEGLAGARVLAMRGILNGTANYVLTRMADGLSYAAALEDAQRRGYAEPDPADDVEAHDVVAKIRVLAAVAFGRQLTLDAIARRGITGLDRTQIERAQRAGRRVKLVASVHVVDSEGAEDPPVLMARVEPTELPLDDLLARIDGVLNALSIETDIVREVTIVGPGAGREQAGQGVFADLLAIARNSQA